MKTPEDTLDDVLSAEEAVSVETAQRMIMAALDHSRAPKMVLLEEGGSIDQAPTLSLPPKALRQIAQLLGQMAKRQPILLLPQEMELTTLQAAAFLNVSRPFVIKELEAGKLSYRLVGTHRRIPLTDLLEYQRSARARSMQAMKALAKIDQDLGLGY